MSAQALLARGLVTPDRLGQWVRIYHRRRSLAEAGMVEGRAEVVERPRKNRVLGKSFGNSA